VGPRWLEIQKTHMALTWVRIGSGLIAWHQGTARLKNAMTEPKRIMREQHFKCQTNFK